MNVIYKVVFNYATGQWTAVSEIAKGKTKSSRTNSAVVEQTTRQVKYSPVRMVSASLLLGLVSFLGTNSAYALTNDDRIQIAVDFLAPDGQRTAVQAMMQNSLEQPVANHLVTNGSRVNIAMKSALADSLDGTVKTLIDTKLQTALAKAVKEQLATDANLKQQVITTVLEDFQKGSTSSQLANDIKNFSVEAVAAELLNNPASTIKAEIEHISKNALSSDLAQKANVSEVNDRFEAHKDLIDSVTDAIHGSEGLNAQILNLKTNSVTKEELEKGLEDKANQSDFNFLNEEVNKLNVGIANLTATQTARDLEQTNTELAELKLSAEATKEILNSQVENINGSLTVISNDVTGLKDKVANAATKDDLKEKANQLDLELLTEQLNNTNTDLANTKGDLATVSTKLDTTANELNNVKTDLEGTKAILESQVDNINGSLAAISNNITDLQDKVANAATKDDLKGKANQLDLELLTEQLNNTNTDLANTKGDLATVSTKLDTTANELNNVKTDLEGTKAILESQVENINGSLATISNDVTDLKGKVANAATKDDLKQKANQSDFNQLTQQVNQNSADVAEAKAAANEVANDLNEFKYNSAVAIAGLAVTTAEEFEKTNAEVEKTKDAVAATQAMLNSQVENINGSLATISNDVTDLKGKVANTATKDDLKEKANQLDLELLTEQLNNTNTDLANTKGNLATVSTKLDTTANEVNNVKADLEGTKAILESQVNNINGSLATISNDVTDLKGKVANAATKDDLKEKANQLDLELLTEQLNNTNTDLANTKGNLATVSTKLDTTANELNNVKTDLEGTKAILESQVENINGSLATISNDVTDLKGKVANAATKDDLKQKANQSDFNQLTQQVNQNSADVAEAKAAANEVANDLNEFKYNSAVAIAGLAVTTAEEFEKTNAEVEKTKDAVTATQAMLNSQVENINGNLATISNDVTDLKGKVANAATKDDLKEKANQSDFNQLTQQANQNSTEVAEAKAAANEVANDLNEFKYNAAAAIAGLAAETEAVLDTKADKVEVAKELAQTNANVADNALAINNVANDLNGFKYNAAAAIAGLAAETEAALDTKADKVEVAKELAQTNANVADNALAINNVANDLNGFKYNAAAAIAGLAAETEAALDTKADKVEVAKELAQTNANVADNALAINNVANDLNGFKYNAAAAIAGLAAETEAALDTKADKVEVAKELAQTNANVADNALAISNTKLEVNKVANDLNDFKHDAAVAIAGLAITTAEEFEKTNADIENNKALINGLDNQKADKTVVTALETKVNGKADTSTVTTLETKVNTKADKTAVTALETKVNGKADTSTVTALEGKVDTKADKTTVTALETKVNGKADTSTVTALEGKVDTKADKTTVTALETKVNGKADTSTVTALEGKVDTKADKTAVTTLETKVNGKVSNETFDSYKVYAEQTYLKQADAQNIQNNISAVEQKVEKLGDNMEKGFAAQAALTGLFQPYNVGKVNTSVALGGYKSQNAIAFGAGYRPNENFAIKGGFASSTSGGNTSYNIGINYEW